MLKERMSKGEKEKEIFGVVANLGRGDEQRKEKGGEMR